MLSGEAFLLSVERFLKRSGMKATTFGTQAVGDPSLVSDLRGGRAPSILTAGRIEAFIKAKDVERRAAKPRKQPRKIVARNKVTQRASV